MPHRSEIVALPFPGKHEMDMKVFVYFVLDCVICFGVIVSACKVPVSSGLHKSGFSIGSLQAGASFKTCDFFVPILFV